MVDVQSNARAHVEGEHWLDVHLVKDGTGRRRLALVSKQLETDGFVRNRTSLDGLKLLRAFGPRPEKCRQCLLELARHSAWFLFSESDCFKHKIALAVQAQQRYGDEMCRWFGLLQGYFCTLAKFMNFARCISMAKKILYAWADLFNDEDAVKYAGGC